jgi:lipopolysaccharide/colanic/teichoic acid biosynthesis glycosyltransferase
MMSKLQLLYVGEDNGIVSPLKNDERFELTIKPNGISALGWLEENRNTHFDAILCNMFMQGVNGIAFFEEMRHKKFLQTHTPFILVSKNFRTNLRKNAFNSGIDDYYASPLSPEKLSSRIPYLLDYKQVYSKRHQKVKKEDLSHYTTPFLKRAFDVSMAGLALIFLSPIFVFTAIAIRMESKGKVFYASKRVGKNFETFDFYKFRSMYPDADQRLKEVAHLNQYKTAEVEEECSLCAQLPEGEYCSPTYEDDNGKVLCERIIKLKRQSEVAFLKIENDPRITKVGKFIRNTSIDELPQLINIIKGDMSVVGNRPLPVGEANALTKSARGKRLELGLRFNCAAGLTGLWQVELRGRAGQMSEEERFDLDKEYALNNSFWGDMKLLFRTFFVFLKNDNV